MSDNAPFIPKRKVSVGRLNFVASTPGCEVKVAEADSSSGKKNTEKTPAEPSAEEIAAVQIAELKQAHALELEKVKREAHEAGRQEGAKSRDPEIQKLQTELKTFREELPGALDHYFSELEEQMKKEVIQFSMRIAEATLEGELQNKQLILPLMRDVLAPLVNQNGVRLHLNPVYLETESVKNAIPQYVTPVPDPMLKLGEVVAETPQGSLEAKLGDRLTVLKEQIEAALARQKNPPAESPDCPDSPSPEGTESEPPAVQHHAQGDAADAAIHA